ncbi:19205_t:CDS:2 [Cetraspora pellucida]|uniref:19205_t:CDS:1 n=1 Tax=Cetraspora pellucida TaxID=1433469 RepID=A0A9N9BD50_9GLOM|nr:19205_t:CDS:2 [Cetraspora pellucida]
MAIAPAIGLVALTKTIIKIIVQETVEIYENTTCTEYTCQIFSESGKNKSMFSEREFYLATHRFRNTLNQAKSFAEEVTKFKGIKKYWNANNVRKRFDRLMKDYDGYMGDLNTTITVTNAVQHMIDMNRIIKEFENLDKFLKNNKKSTDNITIQEISCIQNHQLTMIDSKDLSDPAIIEKKTSNTVFKKLYKKDTEVAEVACKPIKGHTWEKSPIKRIDFIELSLSFKDLASECTTPSDHSPSNCLGLKQDNATESEEIESSSINHVSSIPKSEDKTIRPMDLVMRVEEGLNLHNEEKENHSEISEEMINYLTLSANNGYDKAQYNLGIYYLQKDKQMALKYLNLAASRNNNDAREKLKELNTVACDITQSVNILRLVVKTTYVKLKRSEI